MDAGCWGHHLPLTYSHRISACFLVLAGRSYTSFSINWAGPTPARVDITSLADSSSAGVVYETTVCNNGGLHGSVVVLAFVSTVDRPDEPLRELFDFAKLSLSPAACSGVSFSLSAAVVASVTEDGCEVLLPGQFAVTVGERSAFVDGGVHARLTVEGSLRVLSNYTRHLMPQQPSMKNDDDDDDDDIHDGTSLQ